MDVHSENTDSLFVNYVDPNASHSLLLGQTPVPGPPLQTINLPSGIALTPGTVLTLQNGQILRIEQTSSEPVIVRPSCDVNEAVNISSDPLLQDDELRRKVGRPKNEENFEKPETGGRLECRTCDMVCESLASYKRHLKTHHLDRRHRCKECGASYNMEKNYRLHLASHQVGEKLICPECNKTFSRLASLKCHLAVHEEEDNLVCSECGEEFTTEKQLENHNNAKHLYTSVKSEHHRLIKDQDVINSKPRSFWCKTCSKGFANSKELREHQIKHKKLKSSLELIKKRSKTQPKDGIPGYPCKFCSKRFLKPSQVIRHERIHTGERPFTCQECGHGFTQKQSLEAHLLKHTGQKPYACSFCSMKFSQRGNLRAHIQRVHNIEDEDKFKCSHCTCSFKKLGSLNAHISRFHPDETQETVKTLEPDTNTDPLDPFLTLDDQDFESAQLDDPDPGPEEAEPGDLLSRAIHSTIAEAEARSDTGMQVVLGDRGEDGKMKKHLVRTRMIDNIRYFVCNFCLKEFRKPSDLVRHIRIHTKEKPYKCTQCSKRFSVKSTLVTHLKIHQNMSDREKIACDKCDKSFYSSATFKAHLKNHENPIPCDMCSETFITTGSLNEHKEIVHKDFKNKKQTPYEYSDIKLAEPLIITHQGLLQNTPRHSSVYSPSASELAERQFHCTYCSAVFKKSSHLVAHTRSHTGERPYVCFKCSKSFVSRGGLNTHLASHDNNKMFQCGSCDMMFTTAGSARRHMAVHQEERNFMCPYCEKTFKTNVNCKKHMKTHIGSLTAQNPIGKYPPDVIIENPANLHSETVSSDLENNLKDSGLTGSVVRLNENVFISDPVQVVTKPVQAMEVTQPLEARMYTADESGTITLHQPEPGATSETVAPMSSLVMGEEGAGDMVTLQVESGDLGLVMNQLNIKLDTTNTAFQTQPLVSEKPQLTALPEPQLEVKQTPVIKERPALSGHTVMETLVRHNTPAMDTKENGLTSITAPGFRKRTGTHLKLSDEQTRALADTPLELAKTESEKMLLSSALEKVKTESSEGEGRVKGDSDALRKEVHINQCDQCDASFRKPSDLIRHIRTHTGERPYSCDICEKKFTVKSTLRTHMKVHVGSKNLICHVCQSMFSSKTSLKVHMRLHTGALPYKCDHCEKRFRTPANRKSHVQSVHLKPEANKDEGEMVPLTISAESLASALEQVSRSGAPLVGATVQLQLHGHGFESALTQLQIDEDLLSQLRKGENINITISKEQLNNDKETPIEEVDKEATHSVKDSDVFISNLEEGEVMLQPGAGSDKPVVLSVKPSELEAETVSADGCFLVSSDKADTSAVRTDPILIVPEAGDQLLSGLEAVAEVSAQFPEAAPVEASDVMERMELSGLAQVYICPWCDSVFRSERERSDHLLSLHGIEVRDDTGQAEVVPQEANEAREKRCHVCDKTFTKPSQLVRHMRVHTGERPFACLMCKKSFNQKNALQIHMKKHTGERPHVCPHCEYAFSQKGNLKTHIMRSHSTEANFKTTDISVD